jgi:hypothetical protein
MRRTILLGTLLTLGVSAAAPAEVVTLNPSKDNTLFEDSIGGLSNGAGAYMFVGENRAAVTRRGVTAFDLSDIPSGAIIDSVTLRVHCSRTSSGARAVQLHRLTADWGEGTSDSGDPGGSGAAPTAGDATWIHTFYDQSFWSAPGGDFSATVSSAVSVNNIGFYTFPSSAGLVADVQHWVNDPADNFGWLLMGPENGGASAKRLDTREHLTPEWRPALTINYSIPEPTSIALLIVGVTTLRRR